MKWTIITGFVVFAFMKNLIAQDVKVYSADSEAFRKVRQERKAPKSKLGLISSVGLTYISTNKNQDGFSSINTKSGISNSLSAGLIYTQQLRKAFTLEVIVNYAGTSHSGVLTYQKQGEAHKLISDIYASSLRTSFAIGRDFELSKYFKYQFSIGPTFSFEGNNYHLNDYRLYSDPSQTNPSETRRFTSGGGQGHGFYNKTSLSIYHKLHFRGFLRDGGFYLGLHHWWLGKAKLPHNDTHPEFRGAVHSLLIGYNFVL